MTDLAELKCRDVVELITDYREGILDVAKRGQLEEHLTSCPCNTFRRQIDETIAVLGQLRSGPPGEPVKTSLLAALNIEWNEHEERYPRPSPQASPRRPSATTAPTAGGRERAYKFLRKGRVSPFSGHVWGSGWLEVDGETSLCQNGVHACRASQLPFWLDDELWVIELDRVEHADEKKVVARAGCLVRQVEAWTPAAARTLARACALRARWHTAEALRRSGRDEDARRLMGCRSFRSIAETGQSLMAQTGKSLEEIKTAVGYAVDTAEVAALRGYHAAAADMAAYTAFVANGAASAYWAEREWQARWLSSKLGLA
ncbi:MAG: zf-HC2 domain-containing protein [Actinomycetota bacterium]|nr:zf-HC2 domain-containing protein [Actinomycetota bacterium]MDQ6947455.1 zf-HC2 domain-containing protein [Actinomycetota bacterium]